MGGFSREGVRVKVGVITGRDERFQQSGGVGNGREIRRVGDGAECSRWRTVDRGGGDTARVKVWRGMGEIGWRRGGGQPIVGRPELVRPT